jgi:hypothetical protein
MVFILIALFLLGAKLHRITRGVNHALYVEIFTRATPCKRGGLDNIPRYYLIVGTL